jgi:hypothetical protein
MPAYGERFGDFAHVDRLKQMFDVKTSIDKLALLVDRQKQQINKLQTFVRPQCAYVWRHAHWLKRLIREM